MAVQCPPDPGCFWPLHDLGAASPHETFLNTGPDNMPHALCAADPVFRVRAAVAASRKMIRNYAVFGRSVAFSPMCGGCQGPPNALLSPIRTEVAVSVAVAPPGAARG